jgi:competence protein ComFC
MSLLDFLFPKRCVSCGKISSYICPDCFVKIKTIDTPICPVCTKPAVYGLTHPSCKGRYALDGLSCLFSYRGPIRKIIQKLKFNSLFDLVPDIAFLIKEEIEENELLYKFFINDTPVVVPVPLHWFRERKRGFNQAALLAQTISQRWSLKFLEEFLVRDKYTKFQAKLKKEEREGNIKGVFRIKEKFPSNILVSQFPSVLLVDDIWTTGATMRECGRVLKRAGVKKVWGLTLAR